MVKIATIEEVLPHPNADRLDLVRVFGWWVVTGKGNYAVGDTAVYIPVDAMLGPKLVAYFFEGSSVLPDSDKRHRVRSIKIRKILSQGMVVKANDPKLLSIFPDLSQKTVGEDVASILEITKYEPPIQIAQPGAEKNSHPDFKKYTDIENFKWFPDLFQEGEEVQVTEKLHGSAWRAGWLPTQPRTILGKLMRLVGLAPKYEFVCGSHGRQIRPEYPNFYTKTIGVDVYTKVALRYKEIIPKGYVLYGELTGPKVQKNYTYTKDHEVWLYDIMKEGKYLDFEDFCVLADQLGIARVPLLYKGPYNKELVETLSNKGGKATNPVPPTSLKEFAPKVREGCVIKPTKERNSPHTGRVALKIINPEYYVLKNMSDNH
jgi:RNA ligase (TIGR02306 family)